MKRSTKRPPDHLQVRNQPSTPYQATNELERLLEAGHDLALTGGNYMARVSRNGGRGHRLYEAYTDTQPFVYTPLRSTLQAVLDTLDARYQAAVLAHPPEPQTEVFGPSRAYQYGPPSSIATLLAMEHAMREEKRKAKKASETEIAGDQASKE